MIRRVRSSASCLSSQQITLVRVCSIFKMGQHFVSILAMLHIANKQKDPEFYLEAVIYCFSRSGETSFHRYITHVWL